MNANQSISPSNDVMPKLSVIVVSRSRRQVIERALGSISEQNLPAEHYEVIVALGEAANDRKEYLSSLRPRYSLRIIENSKSGLASALSECVAAARGTVVLFADDDVVLHPGNFRAHLDAHGTEDSQVVHGPTFVLEESADTLATELAREDVVDEIERWKSGTAGPFDFSMGGNHSVLRAKLLACRGFDEELPWRYREELGVRLRNLGLHFVYEPKAVGHRLIENSVDQLVRVEAPGKGRDEIQFLRKHPELRPFSALAGIADAPAWKRLAIQAAARSPVSPDLVLRPAFVLANRVRSRSSMRKFGLRLLRMRVFISFLRGALQGVGWRNLQREFGMQLSVLMYHHVGPAQPDSEPALFVSAARFETQIRFLARRGYVGIRPSDWTAWLRNATPLPEKPVLVTFDDAIADLHDHAFPVLQRYGFNAVVFVPTNCVAIGNLWNHHLGYKWRQCLTAGQIQAWSKKGFDFGAHSRNHPDLTELDALEDEVAGSQSDLETMIEAPVTSFAYPYGSYNAAAAACVQRHFDLGFTTDEGVNTLRTDRSLLRRVTVFDWDTLLEFELMVRLGWNPIRRLRGRLKIRSRLSGILRRTRILHN